MGSGDALDAMAVWFDVDRLVPWLAADPERPGQALQWLCERDSVFAVEPDFHWRPMDPGLEARRCWFEACIWFAGATAAKSASEVRWQHMARRGDRSEGMARARQVARTRGPQWVSDLAARVSMWPFSYRLLAPLLTEFDLPAPPGVGYVRGWEQTLWRLEFAEVTEQLCAEPQLRSLLEQYLASDLVGPQPPILRAAVSLVSQGLLERDWLLATAVQQLTSPPRPKAQREIAVLLAALHVGLADLPGGAAFAATLTATCHGSVAAVMLPLLLEDVSAPDELVELVTTVAARPEKGHKQTVLRALKHPALQAGVGVSAVREALEVLRATSEDTKLTAQVETTLAALPGAHAPEQVRDGQEPEQVAGWWALRPSVQPRTVEPLPTAAPITNEQARALVLNLRSGRHGAHSRADPARDLELDAVVRLSAQLGSDTVTGWLRQLVRDYADAPGWVGEGIRDWASDPTPEAYARVRGRVGDREIDPTTRYAVGPYALWGPVTAMPYLRAREALLGLGQVPLLLATPTRSDHTLSFDALLARLRELHGAAVGPLDLLQALLRLQPTEPSRAEELRGLHVGIDARLPSGNPDAARLPEDALEVIAAWVTAGGMPDPGWALGDIPTGHYLALWVPRGQLPVPESLLAFAPTGLFSWDGMGQAGWAAVLPAWPDLRIGVRYALEQPRNMQSAGALRSALLNGQAEPGLAAYDHLLLELVNTVREYRADAVKVVLELVGQGRFNADLCVRAALLRLEAGVLPLARFSQLLELTAGAGGLAALWPVMTALAGAACSAPRTPTGTADMLRALADVAHEVPDPDLPASVVAFVGRRGSSKAAFEARRLVALAGQEGAA